MKYKPEDYSVRDSGFYGFDDEGIECYKEKLVKCRKPHQCVCGCEKEIQAGEYAIKESGFMDGKYVNSYTSTDCIDKWLDEIYEYESEGAE